MQITLFFLLHKHKQIINICFSYNFIQNFKNIIKYQVEMNLTIVYIDSITRIIYSFHLNFYQRHQSMSRCFSNIMFTLFIFKIYQIFHRDMSIYELCLLQPTDQSLSIVYLWYKVFMSRVFQTKPWWGLVLQRQTTCG